MLDFTSVSAWIILYCLTAGCENFIPSGFHSGKIMQGCGFSEPWLKRVHQEIFFFKDPSWAAVTGVMIEQHQHCKVAFRNY
jgi:hypothetical protein